MLKKNFLTLGMMSLLLSSTLFGNGMSHCTGKVCYMDLKSLKQPSVKVKQESQKVAYPHGFATLPTQETSEEAQEVLEEIVVPEPVVEVASYPEEVEILPLVQTVLSETESEKSLPISTHFCANNKIPVYEEGSEVFTCM